MSRRRISLIGWIALIAVLLWLPQYAEAFWMQTGLFAMSAAIGAIGLTLLVGTTGQQVAWHTVRPARSRFRYAPLRDEGHVLGQAEKWPGRATSR